MLLLKTHVFSPFFPSSHTDGKYYPINGAKIWTVSFGKGDPLFFIAGGPGGTHYGLRSFDSLSKTNTLVYYDGFGRGKSDTAKTLSEYTLERDIEDLNGLRIAMGYNKINILGHSYGGLVAQGYAIKYPENVELENSITEYPLETSVLDEMIKLNSLDLLENDEFYKTQD
jgi:proline iminopeptidase